MPEAPGIRTCPSHGKHGQNWHYGWNIYIEKFNGQNMWPGPSAVRVVYSDASSTGYGGYCIEHGYQVAAGQWLPEETLRNSTWRELRAVRVKLKDFGPKLKNCKSSLAHQ